jgi:glycosyltransferase involved in cell wall biosynthesis
LSKLDLSVVVPVYNEEDSISELCQWIDKVMKQNSFNYEILLVNDGSTDESWTKIESLAIDNPNIKGISFKRNYGKSAALNIGFQNAEGEYIITMDADLQDMPDEIPAFYEMMKRQEWDMISGWKQNRQDPLSKTIPTKLFNAVTRWFSGIHLHDFNCGFKIYKSRVVKSIELYGEMHRYIPVLAKEAGYKRIGEKKIKHQARKYGVTKFGPERFLNGFLDLLSISFMTRFRRKPMHFFGAVGILSFLVGFLITSWLVIDQYFAIIPKPHKSLVTERPLFYLALISIIAGIQLFLAGFLGEMITNILIKRNEYIVADKINLP